MALAFCLSFIACRDLTPIFPPFCGQRFGLINTPTRGKEREEKRNGEKLKKKERKREGEREKERRRKKEREKREGDTGKEREENQKREGEREGQRQNRDERRLTDQETPTSEHTKRVRNIFC